MPFLLEFPGDEGGDVVVLAPQGPLHLLDQDDLGAQRPEYERHLTADDARPDDQEPGRDRVERRQVVRREDGPAVELETGDLDRPRSGGDDDLRGRSLP